MHLQDSNLPFIHYRRNYVHKLIIVDYIFLRSYAAKKGWIRDGESNGIGDSIVDYDGSKFNSYLINEEGQLDESSALFFNILRQKKGSKTSIERRHSNLDGGFSDDEETNGFELWTKRFLSTSNNTSHTHDFQRRESHDIFVEGEWHTILFISFELP